MIVGMEAAVTGSKKASSEILIFSQLQDSNFIGQIILSYIMEFCIIYLYN